jgi:hypothetical protein
MEIICTYFLLYRHCLWDGKIPGIEPQWELGISNIFLRPNAVTYDYIDLRYSFVARILKHLIFSKGRLVQWSFIWFGAFSSTGSNPVATHAAKIFKREFCCGPAGLAKQSHIGGTAKNHPTLSGFRKCDRTPPGSTGF